ncbi:putative Porin domain-containing protein [uncultured Gammaproteobacteria bacterium]
MTRSLLAGCAAIAIIVGCGAAMADPAPGKFGITLGGDAYFTAGFVSQNADDNGDGNGRRTTEFMNRFRLVITPTARADNGLEYGGRLRVRANGTATDQRAVDADVAYIYVSGNFGRIEAGVNDSPLMQNYVIAPNGFGSGGIDGDWSQNSTWFITNSTANRGSTSLWYDTNGPFLESYPGGGFGSVLNNNQTTKLAYYTPKYFTTGENTGLFGMISYTPVAGLVNGSSHSNVNRLTRTANGGTIPNHFGQNNFGNYADVVEVGARYDASYESGISVSTAAGYIGGSTNSDTGSGVLVRYNDLSAYYVGGQIGYADFLIGGSYTNAGKSGYRKSGQVAGDMTSDQYNWTAGISYTSGPVVVGFNYQHGNDAGDLAVVGNRTADLYSVGVMYTLAPGLTEGLEYVRINTNNEPGISANPNTWSALRRENADLVLFKTALTF